jgi:hypothetical protein
MEKEAYKVAKKAYYKKITIKEGVDELQKKFWNKDTKKSLWNEHSAEDYIRDFRYFVDNETRTRMRTFKHVLYYLSQIFIDDNNRTKLYDNALSAFKKHNDYFKNERGENLPNHVLLYNELKKDILFIDEVCQYYQKNEKYFTDKELKLHIKSQQKGIDSKRKQNSKPNISENVDFPDTKPTASSDNEINKYLNQICRTLVQFLDKALSNISNDWWKKTVINKLTDSQRAMTKKKNITSLEELDIAALLRVFEQNCYEISQQCSFTYREGRHSVDGVILVRNRWAHSPSMGYTENITKRDVDILQCFLKLLNDEV